MNWTAVGAIGELVGAAVVVVTLIYLAVQIRQNTRATRAQATASIASEMEHTLLAVAQTGDLADAYLKASQQAQLSPVEAVRLLFWWGSFVRNAESHVVQVYLGTLSEDVRLPIAILLRQFLQIPILKDALAEWIRQEVQGKAFRDWVVENVLRTGRRRPTSRCSWCAAGGRPATVTRRRATGRISGAAAARPNTLVAYGRRAAERRPVGRRTNRIVREEPD